MLRLLHRFLRKNFIWLFNQQDENLAKLTFKVTFNWKKKIEIHKKEAYSSSSAVDTIIIRLMEKNNPEENIYTLERVVCCGVFFWYTMNNNDAKAVQFFIKSISIHIHQSAPRLPIKVSFILSSRKPQKTTCLFKSICTIHAQLGLTFPSVTAKLKIKMQAEPFPVPLTSSP